MEDLIKLIAQHAREIRALAGATGCPWRIVVVPGGAAPAVVGRGYHWRNASGDIIRHPGAYRRAYGRPIYHASTRRIEVGAEWLRRI